MPQIASGDKQQVILRDTSVARDSGTEEREQCEEDKDVAGGVREDQGASGDGGEGCAGVLGGYVFGGRVPG